MTVVVVREGGASAYEIAVANGFEGTEEEWLASLQGAPGASGELRELVVPADGTEYVLTVTDGVPDYNVVRFTGGVSPHAHCRFPRPDQVEGYEFWIVHDVGSPPAGMYWVDETPVGEAPGTVNGLFDNSAGGLGALDHLPQYEGYLGVGVGMHDIANVTAVHARTSIVKSVGDRYTGRRPPRAEDIPHHPVGGEAGLLADFLNTYLPLPPEVGSRVLTAEDGVVAWGASPDAGVSLPDLPSAEEPLALLDLDAVLDPIDMGGGPMDGLTVLDGASDLDPEGGVAVVFGDWASPNFACGGFAAWPDDPEDVPDAVLKELRVSGVEYDPGTGANCVAMLNPLFAFGPVEDPDVAVYIDGDLVPPGSAVDSWTVVGTVLFAFGAPTEPHDVRFVYAADPRSSTATGAGLLALDGAQIGFPPAYPIVWPASLTATSVVWVFDSPDGEYELRAIKSDGEVTFSWVPVA